LNSNPYFPTALSEVIETKKTEYLTTQSAETLAQTADVITDYHKNTQISNSITFCTKN
jgi:hypothetical protein